MDTNSGSTPPMGEYVKFPYGELHHQSTTPQHPLYVRWMLLQPLVRVGGVLLIGELD
jgi:hypothetical protein